MVCFYLIKLAIGSIWPSRLHTIGSTRPLLNVNVLWRWFLWQTSHTTPLNNGSRQAEAVGCLAKTGLYFWPLLEISKSTGMIHYEIYLLLLASLWFCCGWVLILLIHVIQDCFTGITRSHSKSQYNHHKQNTTNRVHISWETAYILKRHRIWRPVVPFVTIHAPDGCLNLSSCFLLSTRLILNMHTWGLSCKRFSENMADSMHLLASLLMPLLFQCQWGSFSLYCHHYLFISSAWTLISLSWITLLLSSLSLWLSL